MITYLLQGAQIGLGLAILVGPLIVLLIQLSLEEGTLSSLMAALGIWVSDLLFVLAAHFGMGQLQRLVGSPNFNEFVGTIGGIILIVVGLGMWIRRPPEFGKEIERRPPRYLLSFFKGFAINTFNPFPVFFWPTVAMGIVYEERLLDVEAAFLYGGILGVVILTDTLKVIGARYLRKWLTPDHARSAQRLGAIALMVFGVVLWVRVWI